MTVPSPSVETMTRPLRPEETHVFEPDDSPDKFVTRCLVCGRGRRALVHRE